MAEQNRKQEFEKTLNSKLPNWPRKLLTLSGIATIPVDCVAPDSITAFQRRNDLADVPQVIEDYVVHNITECERILENARNNFITDPTISTAITDLNDAKDELERTNDTLEDYKRDSKYAVEDLNNLKRSRVPSTDPTYTSAQAEVRRLEGVVRTAERDLADAKRKLEKSETAYTRAKQRAIDPTTGQPLERTRESLLTEVNIYFNSILLSLNGNKEALENDIRNSSSKRWNFGNQSVPEKEAVVQALEIEIERIESSLETIKYHIYDVDEPNYETYMRRSMPGYRDSPSGAGRDRRTPRENTPERNGGRHQPQISKLNDIMRRLS